MILVVVFSFYSLLIIALYLGTKRLTSLTKQTNETTNLFSIVIPFRNEEQHLASLINSLHKLNYPKSNFEVLFVDDESSDRSVEIINKSAKSTELQYQIIPNNRVSNSPKKDAITTAINHSQYNWIVTTDADCIVPKEWLNTLDDIIKNQSPNMIVGPVNLPKPSNFIEHYQQLDFYSLQASTMGGFGVKIPFMSNGANLVYKKDIFNQLNGFSSNNHIASGDDIFLLQKFLQLDSNKVVYSRFFDSIVTTFYENSWKEMIEQRIRWAAKSKQYTQTAAKAIGLIVFITNLFLVIGFLFPLRFYAGFFVIKVVIDFLLINQFAKFVRQKLTLSYFFISSLLYPFVTTYIALKAMLTKYTWKGRVFTS